MFYDAVLLDAGTGNLHSVYNALTTLGFRVKISRDPVDLVRSTRIILPGVGAFGQFIEGLRRSGLDQALRLAVQRGDPMLGICVGMQALFEMGEELGATPGLGLLRGRVTRFPAFSGLKIPHTGWNQINPEYPSALLQGLHSGDYAYFNHSYYCVPSSSSDPVASTSYGLKFTSIVQRENIFGVQFHPEKSQRVGLQILSNFVRLYNVKIYDFSRH